MDDLRYEIKATCPAALRPYLLVRLRECGLRNTYPVRTVNSLYWDTPNGGALAANLSGIANRDKLRLRWYGEHDIHEPLLELKYKCGSVGGKEQFVMNRGIDLTDSYRTIRQQLWEEIPTGIWRARLQQYPRPALIERYVRTYYGLPNSELRVTIDEGLTSYPQQTASSPNLSRYNPQSAALVVEIKAPSDDLLRLTRLAGILGLDYAKHSKFVRGLVSDYTGSVPAV